MIRCCTQLFLIDPRLNAYMWDLESPEEAPFVSDLMVSFRKFDLFDVIEANLNSGLLDASALLINLSNYTAEVVDAFGEDRLPRVLIGLLNLLSPHRFAAVAPLLAAITPIHMSLLQFLRQYIDRNYGNGPSSQSSPTNYAVSEITRINITPDQKLIAFGRPMDAFDRLSAAERSLLVSLTSGPSICERMPTSVNGMYADWLFDFCVESLNDVRVDEVSQNDYMMRIGSSKQYTPLIIELLSHSPFPSYQT